MRYRDNKPVAAVLAWLKDQNCVISRGSYQEFMARVLHVLSLEQAREFGVDIELLRAIRVRYKLPVDPRRARKAIGKPAPRHNSRAKRRKIGLLHKPKPIPPRTTANVRQTPTVDPAKTPFHGIEAKVAAPTAKLHGDPSKPKTLRYRDWKIINEEARTKIAKQSRHIFTNDAGTVSNFRTRKQYTEEDLMAEFGLTPAEARSCFLTLDV